MKNIWFRRMAAGILGVLAACGVMAQEQSPYVPALENIKARQEFADSKLGIFIHWGVYSLFGQGEWFMTTANIDNREYAKAASAFYPIDFDAKEWVSAIKGAGAKYICFTSRHHDGFSMWDTEQSDYNIVDATPFGRDVVKELADECHRQGIKLHFYYSHIDWTRDDYPAGITGRGTGKNPAKADWASYYAFMNSQLTELLSNYGEVGAIWFDGWWDHQQDSVPFDWQLKEQYELIHRLQPACLVGNNHHQSPIEGEDIQLFERDLPGETKAGFSGQEVSRLPLETCQTMNGMWGYRVADQNYKSAETLIRYLVSTSGKGANLLLNIGPQPNGELPAAALDRLKAMGEWTSRYGETIYGTVAGDIPVQEWGVTTRKGNRLFVHIFNHGTKELRLPLRGDKVKRASLYDTKQALKIKRTKEEVALFFDEVPSGVDYIVVVEMRD